MTLEQLKIEETIQTLVAENAQLKLKLIQLEMEKLNANSETAEDA